MKAMLTLEGHDVHLETSSQCCWKMSGYEESLSSYREQILRNKFCWSHVVSKSNLVDRLCCQISCKFSISENGIRVCSDSITSGKKADHPYHI